MKKILLLLFLVLIPTSIKAADLHGDVSTYLIKETNGSYIGYPQVKVNVSSLNESTNIYVLGQALFTAPRGNIQSWNHYSLRSRVGAEFKLGRWHSHFDVGIENIFEGNSDEKPAGTEFDNSFSIGYSF